MSVAKGGRFWKIPEPSKPASKFATSLMWVVFFSYFAVFLTVIRLFNEVNEGWEYAIFTVGVSLLVALGMGVGPKLQGLPKIIDERIAKTKKVFTR